MPDGAVVFNTELNNAQLEKDLASLTKKIEKAEQSLSEKKVKRSSIQKELQAAKDEALKTEQSIKQIKNEISTLQNIGVKNPIGLPEAQQDLKGQEAILKAQNKEVERLDKEYQKVTDSIIDASGSLRSMKEDAGGIQENLDLEADRLQYIADGAIVSDRHIVDLKKELNALKITLADLKKAGIGEGFLDFEVVVRRILQINEELKKYRSNINSADDSTGNIADSLSMAQEETSEMSDKAGTMAKRFDKLGERITKLATRALVFSVITKGLTSLREWMGDVISVNDEASSAIARLKGALLTMVQPLVDVIIPAFTTLVNLLTAVIGKIAAFLSALGGKTVQQSSDAAKALNKQTSALNGVGSAAKEAKKQLMGFDEINQLSDTDTSGGGGGTSGTIQPDFSWADGVSETLDKIADYILLIAAGFALWKISDLIPGALGDILGKIGLLLVALGGFLIMIDGIKNAWENGVDWGNAAEMILGLTVAAVALYAAFGKIASGIALVVGGAALIVTAFHDMMENGVNLQNTLLAIAGIMAAGIGIGLMTGSWIPLLIAGIASVLLALTAATGHGGELIDGLKTLCQGFIDFFVGAFTNDWERAWEGIKNVAKGAANMLISIVNSMISLVVAGLNMISFDVPEWIPGIGGKRVGFNIQNAPQIPYLAQGAVIPPNREFMAVLGDQTSGYNIEAPEALIRKIVREEIAGSGNNDEIVALLETLITTVQNIKVGDEVIGRAAARYTRNTSRARGV